jgi:hypothetical protein
LPGFFLGFAMSIRKNLFVLTAVLSILSPAAGAQCATDLTDSICFDQVKLAVTPTHVLLARGRIDDTPRTPFVLPPKQPKKMVPESGAFSQEGSTMRWLYSTIADKRVFAMYTGPQRGRPAELRVTVRLSLL